MKSKWWLDCFISCIYVVHLCSCNGVPPVLTRKVQNPSFLFAAVVSVIVGYLQDNSVERIMISWKVKNSTAWIVVGLSLMAWLRQERWSQPVHLMCKISYNILPLFYYKERVHMLDEAIESGEAHQAERLKTVLHELLKLWHDLDKKNVHNQYIWWCKFIDNIRHLFWYRERVHMAHQAERLKTVLHELLKLWHDLDKKNVHNQYIWWCKFIDNI